MLINGRVALKGSSNDPTLLEYGDANDTGADGNLKYGILKFANGVKIQWDTISLAANTTTSVALREPYTESHWSALSGLAQTVPSAGLEEDTSAWVPSVDSLSKLSVRNIANSSRRVTWLSIGKDVV